MGNFIVVFVIVVILALAILKIRKEKKKGAKCVGCPYSVSANNGAGCKCNQ